MKIKIPHSSFLIPHYVKVYRKKNFNFSRDFVRDNFRAVRFNPHNAGQSFSRRKNERGNDRAEEIGAGAGQADFNSIRRLHADVIERQFRERHITLQRRTDKTDFIKVLGKFF